MYYVCLVEYFGANSQGWQIQPGTSETIQSYVSIAIEKFTGHCVQNIDCAGRTDKGVHALFQVIGFESSIEREGHKWITGLNHYLPDFIRIINCYSDNQLPGLHPRFSAKSRTYRYYYSHNRRSQSCLQKLVTPFFSKFDHELLHACAQKIIGTHDFQSFQGGSCQAQSSIKECFEAEWFFYLDFSVFKIRARSFLHHMVRYLVGCQMQVAMGTHSIDWFDQLLAGKQSQNFCAPSQGLYLTHVQYDPSFCIDKQENIPWFDPQRHTPKS